MTTDCHTHLWKEEHLSEEFRREGERMRGGPMEVSVAPEAHWKAMEAVDKAIVFGLRAHHVGMVVPNDLIAQYVAQHPEKLIGFTSIDPNEPNYLDELRRTIEDLQMRGLKLGPVYQNYHPMDDRMRPVYEYCQRKQLPILIHQATTYPRRAPLKFASPLLLEDVALAYPDLVMVIAHMGHPWIAETIVFIRKHPNLFVDISALYYRPWQFYNGMMLAVEYGVTDKLLFGSDYPVTTPGDSIQGLKEINRVVVASGLPRVPDKVVTGILERDTLSLLRLK